MHTEKLLVALDTSDQVKHLQENTIQRMAFNLILVTVDRIGIVAWNLVSVARYHHWKWPLFVYPLCGSCYTIIPSKGYHWIALRVALVYSKIRCSPKWEQEFRHSFAVFLVLFSYFQLQLYFLQNLSFAVVPVLFSYLQFPMLSFLSLLLMLYLLPLLSFHCFLSC